MKEYKQMYCHGLCMPVHWHFMTCSNTICEYLKHRYGSTFNYLSRKKTNLFSSSSVDWDMGKRKKYLQGLSCESLLNGACVCPFIHLFVCSSLFWWTVNNFLTVCLTWVSKVPKEAYQWAGSNSAHNFGVKIDINKLFDCFLVIS